MTTHPEHDEELAAARILGDQRIFQSVFNDLKMRHEIVTTADGRQQYAYVYDGVDPYELEDDAFIGTTKAILAHTAKEVAAARIAFATKALMSKSLEQTVVDELGYGIFRAIQDGITASLQANNKGGA